MPSPRIHLGTIRKASSSLLHYVAILQQFAYGMKSREVLQTFVEKVYKSGDEEMKIEVQDALFEMNTLEVKRIKAKVQGVVKDGKC